MSAPADVYDAAALASILLTTPEKVLEWRRTYGWPSFKIGREVRFTAAHVEQIIASHSRDKVEADDGPALAIPGQTSRSARRGRAG